MKTFFCSSLDLEWKLEHLRGRENYFCFLPDLEWKLGHVRSDQAYVHYMLKNGITVLSLENENLSREKKIKTVVSICSAGSISSRCVSLHFKNTSLH